MSKYAFYDIGRACLRGKPRGTVSNKINPPSFDAIFGGPSKEATSSSRRDLSFRLHTRTIAGVKVPARPTEPGPRDCCMSGCINCVWELFNADLEDWKSKRAQAVVALKGQEGERWPSNWETPPKSLPSKYIPLEYKDAIKEPEHVKMPVGIDVFTQFERKRKEQKISKSINFN